MQSKRASLAESAAQVSIGYVINVGAQMAIFPAFGVSVAFTGHLGIGACFVGISLARQYLIRRFFSGN